MGGRTDGQESEAVDYRHRRGSMRDGSVRVRPVREWNRLVVG